MNFFTLSIFLFLSVSQFFCRAQNIDWLKIYDWSGNESAFSIAYSEKHQQYIWSGGTSIAPIYGRLDQNGDTVLTKFYPSDSLLLNIRNMDETFFKDGIITKTIETHSINWWEKTENVSRFDFEGNLIWKSNYVETYPESWSPKFLPITDGGAIVNGQVGTGYWNQYVARFDNNGNKLFEKMYYQNGVQYNSDFQTFKDGSFWISGREHPNSSASQNPFMMKVDSDGNLIEKDTIPTIIWQDTNSYLDLFSFTPDDHILCDWFTDNGTHIMKLDTNYNLIWKTPEDQLVGRTILLDNGKVFALGTNRIKLYDYNNGDLLWSHIFPDTSNGQIWIKDFAFDGNNNVVVTGFIDKWTGLKNDMFFAKISGIGNPAKRPCNNPPEIHWATADVVGQNIIQLADSASEYLKHSDIVGHYWYFMDGGHLQGQFNSYSFDNTLYPDSFWCQLVVTDGVGCTDTMTIDAYTGEVIYPNPTYEPPLGTKETLRSAQRDVRVYPNPFTDQFVVRLSSSLQRPHIQVMDMLGKQMNIEYSIMKEGVVINGSSLPKGMYMLHIQGYGQIKIVKR